MIEPAYIVENRKTLARLKKVAGALTEKELERVIYKEGWTISVMLAHLAFCDERRRCMFAYWRQKGVCPTPYMDDVVNDALIPVMLKIPPKDTVSLAVGCAEAVDQEIEELSDKIRREIEALNEPRTLNRAEHRTQHLDEIEAFLKRQK
jgi:hypothetical protein